MLVLRTSISRNALPWVIAGAAALVNLISIVTLVAVKHDSGDTAAGARPTPSPSSVAPGPLATPSAAPTPAPTRVVPSPAPVPGRPGTSGAGQPSFKPKGVATGPDHLAPLGGVFGAASEWRRNISGAPLADNSEEEVTGLAAQVADHYNGVAAFNRGSYNTTFFTADRDTPRVDVRFKDCQNKGYTPTELRDPKKGAPFVAVPIPPGAVPARGTDAELTIWSPATDQLWEFWQAEHKANGWYACWGGRLDHVSRGPGYFPNPMGATATGLPNAGGMIRIREALAGKITHALSLQLIDVDRYDRVSYPAQRSDGHNPNNEPNRIAEGTRLRLDPSIDVNALDLHPLAKMIARAAQVYGFIVTDQSGGVAVLGESSIGAVAATGSDPWARILGGTPDYAVMTNFPWGALQSLPRNWGKP